MPFDALTENIPSYITMIYNSVEDFICDEGFICWAYKTDPESIAKWDSWLEANPEKKPLALEAATFLQQIKIKEEAVSNQQVIVAHERLQAAIAGAKVSKTSTARLINIGRRKIGYAAAAIIVITAVAIGMRIMFAKKEKFELASNYGQVKQEKLPDGTEIILNANSQLTYPKVWKEGADREVWLKGEAFFHVKKTTRQNKFIVHTDAFDIEVTGTSFDVINRAGKSSIVLKEGSVKIHRPGENEILMKPGDVVEFINKKIQKKTEFKQDYLAWTENKLVFDNTPLSDVAEIIKQHYGVEVKLAADNLARKPITAVMPNDNLEVLLQSLEATQEFTIQRKNDAIIIANKN